MDESQTEAEQLPTAEEVVSVEDAEVINRILARESGAFLPDMDAFNGMMTALVCSPVMVGPPAISALLFDSKSEHSVQLNGKEEAELFLEIVQRQLIDLHYVLSDRKRLYMPHVKCETRPFHHWAKGFIHGMAPTFSAWQRFMDDKVCGHRLYMLMAYANEHRKEIDEIMPDSSIIEKHRFEVIEDLPNIVQHIYDYFAEERNERGDTYPRYYSVYVSRLYTMSKEEAEEFIRSKHEQGEGTVRGPRW